MELIFFGFEAGKSITWGIGSGGPWNGSCTPENLYVACHDNRYINSYTVHVRCRQRTAMHIWFYFCYFIRPQLECVTSMYYNGPSFLKLSLF